MTLRKTIAIMAIAFMIFFFIGASGAANEIQAKFTNQFPATIQTPSDVDKAIEAALKSKVEQNRSQALGFLIYETIVDHIQYSNDGATALVWMALRDPETGEIVETEPGLSIASGINQSALNSSENWAITLQQEDDFATQLANLPEELLIEDIRSRFIETGVQEASSLTVLAPLTGYKLPWTAGLAKRVTNSIGHVYPVSGGLTSCPSSCRYAYDFADGTMFALLASKGGTVKAYKTTCSNGDTNCTNYLVLEDQSTVPTTYQLYYHMAYESIPQRLRTIGAVVTQGEYIGDTDDTGFSTGHHLHYHVYLTPTGTNWSWGNSIDFTYDDVTTNGGYPRTCAEASEYPGLGSQCNTNNLYVSGNTPANPPSAEITAPANRQTITNGIVQVSGSASDDIGISRIQVLVNYDGNWNSISEIPAAAGSFSQEVDLCSASVPNGPFGLTVRVYDREGSQAPNIPVRQLINNSSCAETIVPVYSPACTPGSTQVALYADPDYQGACKTFDVSSSGYTVGMLGGLGDNNVESIQVGSNVRAVLYDESADVTASRVYGRIETISNSDSGLSNNAIGSNRVSGLWVISTAAAPDEPFINALGNQNTIGAGITSLDSLVLSWEGGAGATQFKVTLTGPTSYSKTVKGRTDLSVGNLKAGDYKFSVQAINDAGNNTSTKSFTVTSASFPSATSITLPYQESFESGTGNWIASGLWRYGSIALQGRSATNAWIFNDTTDYNDGTYRAGDLTSQPIIIPSGGPYYLRFWYHANVEDGNSYWDQRRVQISVDGGSFVDLFQLSEDKQANQIWLNSGPISLASYAGKTVRLRFHKDTVDEEYNTGTGWAVDDISITTLAPDTSCASTNSSPASAVKVDLGSSVSGVICPERDADYYKFTATAGQRLLVDVNARTLSPASQLDSYIYLLDNDGVSYNIIDENDDEPGVAQDSLLLYTLQRSGTYYLKIKPWDYPGVGGSSHFYEIAFNQSLNQQPKSVTPTLPNTSKLAPASAFNISTTAVDFDGGPVALVDFYWHGPDWSNVEWVKLGSDTDSSDGWSYHVDPTAYGGVDGSAVYVQATSRTGGVRGTAVWDLKSDTSIPVSQMAAISSNVYSSVVQLNWIASDGQNDIARFDLQYQVNSGSGWSNWQNWTERTLSSNTRSTWFSGASGASYKFRMRAVDRAGNTEDYPGSAEAETTFASGCTPDAGEAQGKTLETSLNLARNAGSQTYNFCLTPSSGAGDVDWFSVNLLKGEPILFMLPSKGGGAAFNINLYNASRQIVASWGSSDYGKGLAVRYDVPANGTYYLEVKPLQPSLFGTDVSYHLWYGPGNWLILPILRR